MFLDALLKLGVDVFGCGTLILEKSLHRVCAAMALNLDFRSLNVEDNILIVLPLVVSSNF